jgi:hypothetical protein
MWTMQGSVCTRGQTEKSRGDALVPFFFVCTGVVVLVLGFFFPDFRFEFRIQICGWRLILSEIMREGTSRFVESTPVA